MNKKRRESIAEAIELLNKARDILETCHEEEQEYLDNMPENLQQGDKGDIAQEAIDGLEAAVDQINEAIDSVEGL